MNKKDVMARVSETRAACERVNRNLARTARVLDFTNKKKGANHWRDTTSDERKELIIEAWWWASEANRRAGRAQRDLLAYAIQSGITVQDIEQHVKRKVAS